MKKKTENKMMWGYRTYQEWRAKKLSDCNAYDVDIFNANLDDLKSLTMENFESSLCVFIAEVNKVNGEDYPGMTLYQLSVSIQKYLNEKGIDWKLVDGSNFKQYRIVLDNAMKERALANIGMVKKQAQFIPHNFQESLWQKGVLGEHEPEILRDTVLFLIGINCGLHAVEEHHDLHRDAPDKCSQFSFQRNEKGIRCLVYTEDTVTKMNDGGLKHIRKDRKVVWVHPAKDVNRCTVRLVEKYMSLCPEVGPKNKPNFYLRPLEKRNPAQWYSTRVVGVNTLRKVTAKLLKSAELDGYFTNHSLRRSGTTRLFQAGVDRKLIKEYTGHVSDAVDQYQVTSDKQRQHMSEVIAGESNENSPKESVKAKESMLCKSVEVKVTGSNSGEIECSVKENNVKMSQSERIGQLVSKMLEGRTSGKAIIKLEVEFVK